MAMRTEQEVRDLRGMLDITVEVMTRGGATDIDIAAAVAVRTYIAWVLHQPEGESVEAMYKAPLLSEYRRRTAHERN